MQQAFILQFFERNHMETITLTIGGMTCGGCVKSVTRILEGMTGVEKADVDLDKKQAVVSFDAAKINIDELINAVEDGGFDASL